MQVSFTVVFVCLSVTGGSENERPPELHVDSVSEILSDAEYRNACGPTACYVAARTAGCECSLDDVAVLCNWRPGRLTTLGEMVDALRRIGQLDVRAVHVTPRQLIAHVSMPGCSAVLPVRKGDQVTDHAFCVVGYQENRFVVIDYPELVTLWTAEQLSDAWDGQALLIRPQRSRVWTRWFAVFPGVVLGLGVTALMSYRRAAFTRRTR
jgi:ABC-type bacteriocin/lantibiotic exporter with double-glycine peptidase domain